MKKDEKLTTIGHVEIVSLPGVDIKDVHARIDTGAQTSAVWVSYAHVENDRLAVRFFKEGHEKYTDKTYYFNEFARTVVVSSNGQAEERFKVKMLVIVSGRKIRARFTLADRSTQVYPVLIGRNVLRGKFLVDVKRGVPLKEAENLRTQHLRSKLNERGKK